MLGPSEGGLGGQDAPDGFPASGRNDYPSGANAFFADVIAMTSENPSHRTGSNANTGKVSNLGKWESAVVGIRCG